MKELKIVISGANGRMGKRLYNLISERHDCKVIAGIDIKTGQYADFPVVNTPALLQELNMSDFVIIDYSHPNSLKPLLQYALATGTPLVLATTGYSDLQIAEIKKAAQTIPVFFTFNMTLGINLLTGLAKKAAEVLYERGFDIEIVERHHNQKVDAPSGTALMLAEAINDSIGNTCRYTYDRHAMRKKRGRDEIGLHAIRGGTIVGEHEVVFAGNDEIITLSHSASSKTVFAVGAVNAALFISDKQHGLFDMNSIVNN
ncbi:MAG: 4-hydroxy-tetrahydrodipicolinate reductase [Oscillospiraceae bacterium]|jgi:4-hydroxy-tetrahydrodipicolinate reductase|nr:4-hydroxy-tetrahydrodipicolinate reductase [Oscillospiraceae bacterium]